VKRLSRFWTLALFLVAAALGQAQVTPQTSYTITPRYAPGQTFSLQLESRIQDARDESPEQVYRAPVTLRVLRNSTSGTLLEWKAGKGTIENSKATSDPMLEMAERIITELALVVQLDSAGRYVGLINEADLRSRVEVFTNLLIPQATAKITDAAARRRTASAMTAALTPEAILIAARKEVDLYFGISGMLLQPGHSTRRKSSLLNPFSTTGSLSGEMEINAQVIRAGDGEVLVEFSQHYDPAQTFQMSAETDRRNELAQLTLDDAGEFLLNTESWRVTRVQHVRTIRRNKQAVRVETTVITLQ
jgi:hypothetical protein